MNKTLGKTFNDLREGAIECWNDAPVKERIEKWDWFIAHLENIEENVQQFIIKERNGIMKLKNEEIDGEVWVKRSDVIKLIVEESGDKLTK